MKIEMLGRAPRRYAGAILPATPAGQRVAGGYRLHVEGETRSSVFNRAIGFAAAAVAAAVFILSGRPALSEFMGKGSFLLLVGVFCFAALAAFALFVKAPVGAYVRYVSAFWQFQNFGGADCVVKPWPLRLGDEATLRFFRAKRQRIAVERVEAFIQIVERYVSSDSQGSSWSSVPRARIALEDAPLPLTGQPLRCEWKVQIPAYEAPSLFMQECEIRWEFCVTLHSAESATASTFPLLVVAEVGA